MFWQIAADVVIHIAVIAAILATGIIAYVLWDNRERPKNKADKGVEE